MTVAGTLPGVEAYYMHYYPAPVLVIQPTLEMGQAFSKDFLAPMLRDTPVLARLVDTRSRYSGNTILKKNFPGGHVTIIGANSPAGLRMRPMVTELIDHIDVYHAEQDAMGKTQRIVIHYNCIGAFEVPDRRKIQSAEITMKTRKGVAVSYTPHTNRGMKFDHKNAECP